MPGASSNTNSAMADPLIDVLGRYKAWASTQRAAVAKPVERLDAGARELSYEDALRANHYPARRRSPEQARKPEETAARDPNVNAECKDQGLESGPNRKAVRTRSKHSEFRSKPDIKVTGPLPKAGAAPKRERPRKADHTSKSPEFRDVLVGTVALSSSAHASVRPDKSVWLTLRVSASEQAVIQARAAEAELSVSAYLRQCAFEVESLREQVKRALAELRVAALPGNDQRTIPQSTFRSGVFGGLLRRAARLLSCESAFSATA